MHRAAGPLLCLLVSSLAAELKSRYDVVVLGSGMKQSLLAGLLASHGKEVLQLDPVANAGKSFDLQQFAYELDGPGAKLPAESKVGKGSDYSIERAPKMFIASGNQLQLLVASGAWQHMSPPGFKRVHRSLMYRQRPDGKPDVHRVLANSEDVVKTRMLAALDKARVVQFFLWIERYDENDEKTHTSGPLSKTALDVHKMKASKFLAFWDLPKDAMAMIIRGMALHEGTLKDLKKLPAILLVRRLKRYKDAYRTFPHMTSPYVYPVGGFGSTLVPAITQVVEGSGGNVELGRGFDEILQDEDGGACGIVTGGVTIQADCVVAAPECVPERVAKSYEVVRLYAVLNHSPNLCKDSTSCQLLMPAAHTGRNSDVYVASYSSQHGVTPKGKWLVVASARVEGSTEGLDALTVAKRELAAVLPLLTPSRMLLAEVVPYRVADAAASLERLLVMSSDDETSYFDSVEAELEGCFQRITGERLENLR